MTTRFPLFPYYCRSVLRAVIIVTITLVGHDGLAQTVGTPKPESQRILVFGATGEVGGFIVDEALDRGHRVVAVTRNPEAYEKRASNLQVARADLLDPESIESLLENIDVVVVSVRGVIGEKAGENALQHIAARNVVAAIRSAGNDAQRLVHIGGAGSLEAEPGVLLADKLPRLFLPKGLEAEIDGQVLALDFLRGVDDVQWTYATPPRRFTNGDRTGQYRIGSDHMLRDQRGRSRVSRADFAVAIVDEIERHDFPFARFSVAY